MDSDAKESHLQPFFDLPPEMCEMILSWLDPGMRFVARLVCKQWDAFFRRTKSPGVGMAFFPSFREALLIELSTRGYTDNIKHIFRNGGIELPLDSVVKRTCSFLFPAIRGHHFETFRFMVTDLLQLKDANSRNHPFGYVHKEWKRIMMSLLSACLSSERDMSAFISVLLACKFESKSFTFAFDLNEVSLTSHKGCHNILSLLHRIQQPAYTYIDRLSDLCATSGSIPLATEFLVLAEALCSDKGKAIRNLLTSCIKADSAELVDHLLTMVLGANEKEIGEAMPEAAIILTYASAQVFDLLLTHWPPLRDYLRAAYLSHPIFISDDVLLIALTNGRGPHMVEYLTKKLDARFTLVFAGKTLECALDLTLRASNLLWMLHNASDRIPVGFKSADACSELLRTAAMQISVSDMRMGLQYAREVGVMVTHDWIRDFCRASCVTDEEKERDEIFVRWLKEDGEDQSSILAYVVAETQSTRKKMLKWLVSNERCATAFFFMDLWKRNCPPLAQSLHNYHVLVDVVYYKLEAKEDYRSCIRLCANNPEWVERTIEQSG